MTTLHANFGPYAVVSSSAKMPSAVRAPYRRLALIQMDAPGKVPALLSDRARGVVRVIRTQERLHARGKRSAFRLAVEEAVVDAERAWLKSIGGK